MLRLICLLSILFSCSKEGVNEPINALSFRLPDGSRQYQKAAISGVPWCGQMLYTVAANSKDEQFMITLVTPELKVGTYQAGANLWPGWIGDITLTVKKIEHNKLYATFSGDGLENGQINNVDISSCTLSTTK